MKTFCFDLTCRSSRTEDAANFLVHDSKLYDRSMNARCTGR